MASRFTHPTLHGGSRKIMKPGVIEKSQIITIQAALILTYTIIKKWHG
jgi:hypothetical protein